MRDTTIDQTSKIVNSQYGCAFRCYRNASVIDSTLGENVTVGDDTTIARCNIGNNVAINRRSYFNDSKFGDFSYSGSNTIINFSEIGKFCSLARNVDIGGFDHDYRKFTTMPMFRFSQLISGMAPEAGNLDLCKIGNDVWIAAGAQILHKVTIGDGAVIGAGAVVTRDIPPYAIAVGIPAKVIKYRFPKEIIEQLLVIKWWDWPDKLLLENIEWLINSDVNDETIVKMRKICESIEVKK